MGAKFGHKFLLSFPFSVLLKKGWGKSHKGKEGFISKTAEILCKNNIIGPIVYLRK